MALKSDLLFTLTGLAVMYSVCWLLHAINLVPHPSPWTMNPLRERDDASFPLHFSHPPWLVPHPPWLGKQSRHFPLKCSTPFILCSHASVWGCKPQGHLLCRACLTSRPNKFPSLKNITSKIFCCPCLPSCAYHQSHSYTVTKVRQSYFNPLYILL